MGKTEEIGLIGFFLWVGTLLTIKGAPTLSLTLGVAAMLTTIVFVLMVLATLGSEDE